MNRIALAFPLTMAIFLTGCLDKRDKQVIDGPSISKGPPAVTKGDLDGKLGEVVDLVGKRMDTSQNAIQSNMQSVVGLSVGKVADDLVKLQAQFRSMAEVNAKLESRIGDISNSLNASVASNNDLRVMLKAQMDFNAQMIASIKVSAEMEAKINALGAAQVGIGNKLDQTTSELKQSFSAGRDVNSTNTEFTKEMLQALQSANKVTSDTSQQWAYALAGLVATIGSIATAYLHFLRKRAEKKADDAGRELTEHRQKLERALSVLIPNSEK